MQSSFWSGSPASFPWRNRFLTLTAVCLHVDQQKQMLCLVGENHCFLFNSVNPHRKSYPMFPSEQMSPFQKGSQPGKLSSMERMETHVVFYSWLAWVTEQRQATECMHCGTWGRLPSWGVEGLTAKDQSPTVSSKKRGLKHFAMVLKCTIKERNKMAA